MKTTAALRAKARKVRMLLLDVDGVMTDGGLYYSVRGIELKRFNAQDGYGIVLARENGVKVGIISGKSTPIIDARAKTLNIDDVFQGSMDKVSALRVLEKRHGLLPEEFAFIGDDLFDLPLLNLVGFSATPRNGRPEVKKQVDYVTSVTGGEGAVRELIEVILTLQGKMPKTPRTQRGDAEGERRSRR